MSKAREYDLRDLLVDYAERIVEPSRKERKRSQPWILNIGRWIEMVMNVGADPCVRPDTTNNDITMGEHIGSPLLRTLKNLIARRSEAALNTEAREQLRRIHSLGRIRRVNRNNYSDPLPVSIVVVNYNGKSFLGDCLTSLKALDPPAREVILVDNGSSDGSVDWVREFHSWVRMIESEDNLGYCGGNNLGIKASSESFVALLNNDTKVEPHWLVYLFEALKGNPRAAACSSLVLLPGDPPLVHYAGSEAHFIGHISNLHYLRPKPSLELKLKPSQVGIYVGSSVLFRREALEETGLLEERFFIYEDELDMALRLRARRWEILFEPRSVVWHFSGTPDLAVRTRQKYPELRAFLVTRNRWLVLLRNYELRTLLLLFPTFLCFELAWAIALVLSGRGKAFFRALAWNWRERAWVSQQRRKIQAGRLVGDRELLSAYPLTPVPGMADSGLGLFLRKAGERGFRLYWKIVKRFM